VADLAQDPDESEPHRGMESGRGLVSARHPGDDGMNSGFPRIFEDTGGQGRADTAASRGFADVDRNLAGIVVGGPFGPSRKGGPALDVGWVVLRNGDEDGKFVRMGGEPLGPVGDAFRFGIEGRDGIQDGFVVDLGDARKIGFRRSSYAHGSSKDAESYRIWGNATTSSGKSFDRGMPQGFPG
jgi:hypothetical protein